MKKNYYAIIPAHIRYDSELIPNAKLMYGEITALSNERGFCYATNNYFANLYNVSKVSISKWINQLKEKGYIKVELIYDGKQIKERKLFIINPEEVLNISLTPIKQNLKDNINTIYNNKEKTYSNMINDSLPHILNLFPASVTPKSKSEINQWKEELEKLERLDNYDARAVYYIIKKVRQDEFWKDNFFSVLKLRKKNKYGVKYIDMFKVKFAKDYEFNK